MIHFVGIGICAHGLQPDQILSTHLLHDFFRYYMNELGHADNPITRMYEILTIFSETQELVQSAQSVSTGERGFSTYTLNGQTSSDVGPQIQKKEKKFNFTPEIDNLKGLYAIFGLDFLIASLEQWRSQRDNSAWSCYIRSIFNDSATINNQLPLILNQIYELIPLQRALAEILDDQTLILLLSQKKANILCLAPFCPQLISFIRAQNIEHYLHDLKQNSFSTLAFISSLLSYLDAISHNTNDVIHIVFLQLIDAILDENYVLEDQKILSKLLKYNGFKACVMQKIRQLEAELHTLIQSQTLASISEMDYLTIEDTWREVASKIRPLQTTFSLKTDCPENKYDLYMHLAKIFYSKNNSLKLNEFITALNITPELLEPTVSPYERVIIELLATIDDPIFRQECISLLDENLPTRDWRNHKYGDKHHFQRAVKHGNLGLIQWLEAQHIQPHMTHNAMITESAKHHHWSVVKYFYQKDPKKLVRNGLILTLVVEQGASHVIAMLWSKSNTLPPSPPQIKEALLLAVKKNDSKTIAAMIQHLKAPKDSIMANAFKQAITLKSFHAVMAIAAYRKGPKLLDEIDKAIMKAARFNQCEILSHLVAFARTPTLKKAFLRATQANHHEATQCFLEKLNPPLPIEIITQAWREAIKYKRNIAAYLEKFCQKITPKELLVHHDEPQAQDKEQPHRLIRSSSYSFGDHSFLIQHSFFGLHRALSETSLLNSKLKL